MINQAALTHSPQSLNNPLGSAPLQRRGESYGEGVLGVRLSRPASLHQCSFCLCSAFRAVVSLSVSNVYSDHISRTTGFVLSPFRKLPFACAPFSAPSILLACMALPAIILPVFFFRSCSSMASFFSFAGRVFVRRGNDWPRSGVNEMPNRWVRWFAGECGRPRCFFSIRLSLPAVVAVFLCQRGRFVPIIAGGSTMKAVVPVFFFAPRLLLAEASYSR